MERTPYFVFIQQQAVLPQESLIGLNSLLFLFLFPYQVKLLARLVDISKMCSKFEIPHVVNNAYGIQSPKCLHLISESVRVGRLDGLLFFPLIFHPSAFELAFNFPVIFGG